MEPVHWSIALLVIWILLPLIPSMLIYKFFPNTQVAASGPFAGLTIATSGAFAAYLIILLAVPFIGRATAEQIRAEFGQADVWTIKAPVHRPRAGGSAPFRGQALRVTTTDPDWYRVLPGGMVVAYVRTEKGKFPMLEVEAPDGQTQVMDLNSETLKKVVDEKNKVILITEPVVLQTPEPYEGTTLGAP